MECDTIRVRGHFEGDRQDCRDKAELEALQNRDPIRFAAAELTKAGATTAAIQKISDEVDAKIETAVEAALAAPLANREDILADVYTRAEGWGT
ncbi:thiamine pyrophosphate-dependent enzyme [Profundibacter sp.]